MRKGKERASDEYTQTAKKGKKSEGKRASENLIHRLRRCDLQFRALEYSLLLILAPSRLIPIPRLTLLSLIPVLILTLHLNLSFRLRLHLRRTPQHRDPLRQKLHDPRSLHDLPRLPEIPLRLKTPM